MGGEVDGLSALKVPLLGGPLYWPGLVMLLVCVVAAPYLRLPGQGYPALSFEIWEGEVVTAPAPALHLSLVAFSFGWAYLLVGAAGYGLGAFVLAAAYAGYFGLAPGVGVARSLWIALVPLWLLLLGGWVSSHDARSLEASSGQAEEIRVRSGWHLALLALLSLMVAQVTCPAVGLASVLPGAWGRLALAAIYFALVANPLTRKLPPFRPAVAFGVTLVLFALLYAMSLQRSSPDEVLDYTFSTFHYLLGLVSLFWFWFGLDLFNGARDQAERVGQIVKSFVPARVLGAVVFSLWVVWSAIAYLLVHGPGLGLMQVLTRYGWGTALLEGYVALSLSLVLFTTLDYHLYVTVAILLLAVGMKLTKRLSAERLMGLFVLSLFGYFALYGLVSAFVALGSEDWQSVLGAWPLLLYVAGMFWEILKAASDALRGARMGTSVFLGLFLTFASIALLELAAEYPYFYQELSLNPLLGILYLGLPYSLYTLVYQRSGNTPVSARNLGLLFVMGMLSAVPSLVWGRMVLAPIVWLVAILATVWRTGRWEGYRDGLVYAWALALGFVAFYSHPVIVPLPAYSGWLGRLVELQLEYTGSVIWPWEAVWWWLVLGALGAAAALGFSLTRARAATGRVRVLLVLLGASLGMALLGLCQSAIIG